MKRFAACLAIFGFMILVVPRGSRAAVLVITVEDPTTMDAYERLSPSEREAALQEIGDIIDVRQESADLESQQFGRMECSNNPPSRGGLFVCLEFRGLSYEEARKLTAPIFHGSQGEGLVFTKYRRYRVGMNALPVGIQSDLYVKGIASLDYTEWRSSILDKEMGP